MTYSPEQKSLEFAGRAYPGCQCWESEVHPFLMQMAANIRECNRLRRERNQSIDNGI